MDYKKDYSISEERVQLLGDNFYEFSFDGREPNKEFFDSITNPLELHYIASIYNWDDGVEVLEWIINSPLCDIATATMIFWRSQPDYYTKFTNKEEATWAGDVYSLLQQILENRAKGFYKSGLIKYDPKKDYAAPSDLNYRDSNEKWPIPEELKQPIDGEIELIIEE